MLVLGSGAKLCRSRQICCPRLSAAAESIKRLLCTKPYRPCHFEGQRRLSDASRPAKPFSITTGLRFGVHLDGARIAVSRDHLLGSFYGPSTLVELLRHRMRCQGDDVAFTYLVDGENEQVQITYKELDRQARAIGAWLEEHGLVGQRALLLYPPGLEFIVAFFGCLYAGVVAVPVYPPRRNRSLNRIQAIADDAETRVALTTDSVLTRVEPLIDATPHLKQLTWLATCHVQPGIEDQWEMPEVDRDTLAFLQYTSGSTGTPKGVALDHANLLHNSALIAHSFEHTRSGGGVFWLPSYHDMGLIGGILQPLYVGRPNVLMSPMAFLQKPYRWLSAISRFRCSTSGGPNFAYELCVRKVTPEQRKTLDLSSWLVAFNGAEPVRAETIQAFTEAFAPCGFRPEAFYPCYGMAEATLIVSGGFARQRPIIRNFDADALTRNEVLEVDATTEHARAMVGCGQSMPDQEVVIADPDTMVACLPGSVGEIWVRGPSIAQGYWNQPETTEKTFHAYLKESGEGPFLRTGDLGFFHEGELFITGRLKDIIIIHGVNHYPQDIELTVAQCSPRLRPDSGAAFTVEKDGRQQLVLVQEIERHKHGGLDDVLKAVRRAISEEHDLAVDSVVLVKTGTIPKTSSGKIQRHACRDGYLQNTLNVVAQWQAASGETTLVPDGQSTDEAHPLTPTQPSQTTKPHRVGADSCATGTAPATGAPVRMSKNGSGGSAKKEKEATAPSSPPGKPLDACLADKPLPPSGGSEIQVKPPTVVELVLEQVRLIAKERANQLTLDTPIAELGLDSLERMEILAALEERFGARFPEEVPPELETCRDVVGAVEKYLGTEPRPRAEQPPNTQVSPDCYRVELFPEYLRLKQNLDLLQSTGLGNPYFTVHEGITNDRTRIGGQDFINFCSYNYVGMSGDPTVIRAAQEAAQRFGTSVSASRLVSGEKPVHRDLEAAIARFIGTDDAVVFVGGHSTNETTIGHLFGPGDLILHDSLSHNSIVQGSLLSGARRRAFPHNDWQAADALLRQYRHEYRRVLLVIEGVYSMDGDIPDLPQFIEVKKRHKTLLMIDEAHSAGTIGPHGRGIGEYYEVDRADVDIWMGTLSKSFGSCGGYIAGCKELVQYLKYTAPGFVYSVGMPPPNAAAALTSLELIEAQPERVIRLQRRSRLFLRLAQERGLNTGLSKDSPVVPVILGNSIHCLQLSKGLFKRGINVQPILHPAVEESAARLRFFITSLHTEDQIRYAVDALVEELEQINPDYLTAKHGQAVVR